MSSYYLNPTYESLRVTSDPYGAISNGDFSRVGWVKRDMNGNNFGICYVK
ncbi:MAG: hypothetical protein Tsb0014_34190 [Pleurocapsa sp.]